jgi:hypothetical protein
MHVYLARPCNELLPEHHTSSYIQALHVGMHTWRAHGRRRGGALACESQVTTATAGGTAPQVSGWRRTSAEGVTAAATAAAALAWS